MSSRLTTSIMGNTISNKVLKMIISLFFITLLLFILIRMNKCTENFNIEHFNSKLVTDTALATKKKKDITMISRGIESWKKAQNEKKGKEVLDAYEKKKALEEAQAKALIDKQQASIAAGAAAAVASAAAASKAAAAAASAGDAQLAKYQKEKALAAAAAAKAKADAAARAIAAAAITKARAVQIPTNNTTKISIKTITGGWNCNSAGGPLPSTGYWSFKPYINPDPSKTWPVFAIDLKDISIKSSRGTIFKVTLTCSTNLPCKITSGWWKILVTPDAGGYLQDNFVDLKKIGVMEYSNNETVTELSDSKKLVWSVSTSNPPETFIPNKKNTITFYILQGFDWYKHERYLDLYCEFGNKEGEASDAEIKIYSVDVQAITNDRLLLDEVRTTDKTLTSNNGLYTLIMQSDGNLVIYKGSAPFKGENAIWASNTSKTADEVKMYGPYYLIMQGDGNLVIYDKNNKHIWASYTHDKGIAYLMMQDDGNLVIYKTGFPRLAENAIWASNTSR